MPDILPLKWTHFPAKPDRAEAWEADHPFGVYFIEHHPTQDDPFVEVCLEDGGGLAEHATLEGAMRATWKEHCEKLLACLANGGAA